MQLRVLTHTVALTRYNTTILFHFGMLAEYLIEVAKIGETLKPDYAGYPTDIVCFSNASTC